MGEARSAPRRARDAGGAARRSTGASRVFNCCIASRLYPHQYKACAWTVCANCKPVEHTQRMYQELCSRMKARAVTAQVCAGDDARLGVIDWGDGSGSLARPASECPEVWWVCESCESDRWRFAVIRDVRTFPYYTWAGQTHEWPFLISCSLLIFFFF